MKGNYCYLFTASFAELGGGELALLEHIKRIKKSHKVAVILLQEGPLRKELENLNVKVKVTHYEFDKGYITSIPIFSKVLIKFLKFCIREKVSLICPYTFTDMLLAGIVGKIIGIPVIWRSQGDAFSTYITPLGCLKNNLNWRKKVKLGLLKNFINYMLTLVIPTTKWQTKLMKKLGINMRKVKYIPLGVDISKFCINNLEKSSQKIKKEFEIESNIPIIGFVARMVTWKGHKIFYQALAKVKHYYPNFKVLIVGDTILNWENPNEFKFELHKLADELNISDKLIYTGFRKDIPAIMKAIDIFVHASLKEPFGLVIIEAMAAGKPVIASKVAGPLESVVDGETGLLVPPGDVEGLTKAILFMLNNQKKQKKMGEAGQKRVKNLFNLDRNITIINKLLYQITLSR